MGLDNSLNNLLKYLEKRRFLFKTSKIIPKFKEKVSNYRPMVILSSVPKMVGRIVSNKVTDFLDIYIKNNKDTQ